MSDSNERQVEMSFDFTGSDVEPVPQDDLESPFQKLLRDHGVKKEEIDDYVDKMHCSYSDALLHFGFSMSEFDDNSGDSISESTPETENSDAPISYEASVNLGARAVHLSGALNAYLQSSKLGGLGHAQSEGMIKENIGPAQIIKSRQANRKKGDKRFHKVSGAQSMIDAGSNPDEVLSTERKLENEFVDRFTGLGNKTARQELRRKLKSQRVYFGTDSQHELLYGKNKKKN